jgi:hypothetical protein
VKTKNRKVGVKDSSVQVLSHIPLTTINSAGAANKAFLSRKLQRQQRKTALTSNCTVLFQSFISAATWPVAKKCFS